MAGKRKYTDIQVIKAVRGGYQEDVLDPDTGNPTGRKRKAGGSGGIVSVIARRLSCEWETAAKYIKERPRVSLAYKEESERVKDVAEGNIIAAIHSGDVDESKWYLTKKAKERGYRNDVDVTSAGEKIEQMNQIIQVYIPDNKRNDEKE